MPYGILSYDPTYSPFNIELGDRAISTFTLSVRDQNSNLVQFNGLNFEISLLLEVYRIPQIEPPPSRRVELPPIQAPPEPEPELIQQPVPVLQPIQSHLPDSPDLPDSPLSPSRPTLTISKSQPMDIPLPDIDTHELQDAILSARLLDLEGLL